MRDLDSEKGHEEHVGMICVCVCVSVCAGNAVVVGISKAVEPVFRVQPSKEKLANPCHYSPTQKWVISRPGREGTGKVARGVVLRTPELPFGLAGPQVGSPMETFFGFNR